MQSELPYASGPEPASTPLPPPPMRQVGSYQPAALQESSFVSVGDKLRERLRSTELSRSEIQEGYDPSLFSSLPRTSNAPPQHPFAFPNRPPSLIPGGPPPPRNDPTLRGHPGYAQREPTPAPRPSPPTFVPLPGSSFTPSFAPLPLDASPAPYVPGSTRIESLSANPDRWSKLDGLEDEQEQARRKENLWRIVGGIVLLLLLVGIAVGTGVGVAKSGKGGEVQAASVTNGTGSTTGIISTKVATTAPNATPSAAVSGIPKSTSVASTTSRTTSSLLPLSTVLPLSTLTLSTTFTTRSTTASRTSSASRAVCIFGGVTILGEPFFATTTTLAVGQSCPTSRKRDLESGVEVGEGKREVGGGLERKEGGGILRRGHGKSRL